MPARHLSTGRSGEEAAARFLEAQGLRILERNWRCGRLELDLIFLDPTAQPETLVFAEVRTRDAGGLAAPAQTLDSRKRRALCRAAAEYLSRMELWERPCRFDLLSVLERDNAYLVEHVPNVFEYVGSLGGGDTAWQPW